MISATNAPSFPVFTGVWTVELPMLNEPVVALMGAGFLKQGFVNVLATRAFQDSKTRRLRKRKVIRIPTTMARINGTVNPIDRSKTEGDYGFLDLAQPAFDLTD